jgi:ATP-dependent DNA ligase
MLPSLSREPFDSPSHIFEIIWDGVRALLFVERGAVRIQDGYGRNVSALYPELQAVASCVNGSGVVLDGVIVCLDNEGRPDFARLHRRLTASDDAEADLLADEVPVTFQAFDILYRNGLSVMTQPLRRRKTLLRQTARTQCTLAVPDFVEREGVAFFEAARAHALQGIVAKERDSCYEPGVRSRSWLTASIRPGQVCDRGYTYGHALRPGRPAVTNTPFDSLLLGQYDAVGALHFVGAVEGAFDVRVADEIVRRLDSLASPESPFVDATSEGRLIFWCRPELVARVRFAERSHTGRLRFPLFEWLRPDVPASACRLPQGVP